MDGGRTQADPLSERAVLGPAVLWAGGLHAPTQLNRARVVALDCGNASHNAGREHFACRVAGQYSLFTAVRRVFFHSLTGGSPQ